MNARIKVVLAYFPNRGVPDRYRVRSIEGAVVMHIMKKDKLGEASAEVRVDDWLTETEAQQVSGAVGVVVKVIPADK